ncbi:hypothetical protein K439DRAFT_1615208 [Ramaria rubella]|nr:hypothetical protein K439DRAFT_1615208 [Ramaria rubella]
MASMLHIIKAPSFSVSQDIEERAKRHAVTGGHHVRAHSSGSSASRISFAFSGFTPISPLSQGNTGPRSASIERTRPSSPLSGRPRVPRSNSFTNMSTTTPLTPLQVYDLAQQCNYPTSSPPTPSGDASIPPTPVNFTPIPDAHHLPFFDRPAEVKELMSTSKTSRLFLLLAQALPSSNIPGQDTHDPVSWTYSQLEAWLTTTTREQADDVEWVQKARICISTRSELIWERIKGALGVPPELDVLYEGSDKPIPDSPCENNQDRQDSLDDAWVEPIVADPNSPPLSPIRSTTPTSFRRSPTLTATTRMQDISEDAPVSPTATMVHGLRVVTSPTRPASRRYSSPPPSSAERGPGHPLFPTSFANLALGPTLRANNPSLRSPPVPPASAYPGLLSRPRRLGASWAEDWDPMKQEYAISVASGSSR